MPVNGWMMASVSRISLMLVFGFNIIGYALVYFKAYQANSQVTRIAAFS